MSESGPAESEEEEELDDQSLGIKSNARSLRLSPRRKTSVQPKRGRRSKGTARGGSGGEANAKRSVAAARRPVRSQAGSSAPGESSSESSSSGSSVRSSCSHDSGSDSAARAGRTGRASRGGKAAPSAGAGRDKMRTKSSPRKEEVVMQNSECKGERGDEQGKGSGREESENLAQRSSSQQELEDLQSQKPHEVCVLV